MTAPLEDIHRSTPKSVLVFSRSGAGGYTIPLCRVLTARWGCRFVLACKSNQEEDWYRDEAGDLFEETFSIRPLYTDPTGGGFLGEDWDASVARKQEARLSFRFHDLIGTDRHYGLGFQPGAINFPQSVFSSKATYDLALRAYSAAIERYERIFDRHEIDFVLDGDIIADAIARGRGLAYRALHHARYKSFHYWAYDYRLDSPDIRAAFEQIEEPQPDIELDAPPDYAIANRSLFVRHATWSGLVRNCAREIARKVYYQLRRYEKRHSYLLLDRLNSYVRLHRSAKSLDRLCIPMDEISQSTDFVYFPLAREPERNIAGVSPDMAHQHFAVWALAKALPAGFLLLVKEHQTAIGPRPDQFYESLAAIPNVVLVPPHQSSFELIDRARATAVVTGTAGLEAAARGKPVISFGAHNLFNVIPHVRQVTSWATLAKDVADLLAAGDTADAVERRSNDGRRFLTALVQAGIDTGTWSVDKSPEPDLTERLADRLEATLGVEELVR